MRLYHRNQLGDCFEHIKFGAMNRNEITQCVQLFGELFTVPELQRLFGLLPAKYPVPFRENEMIRCSIGPMEITVKSMEELRFLSSCRMMLDGI